MGHSKDMSADGGRVGKKTCSKKGGVVVVLEILALFKILVILSRAKRTVSS